MDVDYVQQIAARRISETSASTWVDTLSTTDIRREQIDDKDLKIIISWIENGVEPDSLDSLGKVGFCIIYEKIQFVQNICWLCLKV